MNIWLINHYASDMFRDKAGRHYWFARKLKERGFTVAVICASAYLNGKEQLNTNARLINIKEDDGVKNVFIKTIPAVGNGLKRLENMYLFYHNLKKSRKNIIKETFKPDVILASSVHPLTLVAGIQIAKHLRIPCICEIRDLWPEGIFTASRLKEESLVGRILVAGEYWIYKKADAIVFTKEGDTDYLKEKNWTTIQGGYVDLSKCHYINNGIDLSQFRDSLNKYTLNDERLMDDSFKVIYTGTIRPTNNIQLILDAAKLLKNYVDITFLIYGDGNQRDILEHRILEEEIVNVHMMGRIERKYIPYILSMANINLLNYSADYTWSRGNSSNKLFEYMASGKPILSTVKMGYSIINKYQCGIELETCTSEALAEAIIRIHDMTENEILKYGTNAAQGSKDFDFKLLTEKLISVIDSVTFENNN